MKKTSIDTWKVFVVHVGRYEVTHTMLILNLSVAGKKVLDVGNRQTQQTDSVDKYCGIYKAV